MITNLAYHFKLLANLCVTLAETKISIQINWNHRIMFQSSVIDQENTRKCQIWPFTASSAPKKQCRSITIMFFCGGTIEYSKKKTILAFLNVDLFPYSTKMLRKGHCSTTFTWFTPMVLSSWSKFQVSKFVFEGEDLFFLIPANHSSGLSMQKWLNPDLVAIKARGGVRPQISDFLDSCAEFCGLSGEAIENPQFSVFLPINNDL